MKLAFCLFKYFPFGGLQRDFLRIARACLHLGHEVHIYTMSWEGEKLPGTLIYLIPAKGLQNHKRIASYIKQVKHRLGQKSYDLIIGFNKMPFLDIYYAADVCYQHRVRERHHPIYRLLPRYRHYQAWEAAVFSAGHPTKIFLIAKDEQANFTRYYHTESDRFHLLPPGIDRKKAAPPHADLIRNQYREQFGLSTEANLLLMVGSGFKTKGLDRTLQGIAALPIKLKQETCLFVIGQDKPASFIRQAKRLGVHHQVHFLGGREDVASFLLAADLLVHPAYHENTGTVLLEALAAGLPVLTVDICGYAHYVKEACAGLVLDHPFEQERFNSALQNMLQHEDRYKLKANALSFSKAADIYSLPEKAAALIDEMGRKRVYK